MSFDRRKKFIIRKSLFPLNRICNADQRCWASSPVSTKCLSGRYRWIQNANRSVSSKIRNTPTPKPRRGTAERAWWTRKTLTQQYRCLLESWSWQFKMSPLWLILWLWSLPIKDLWIWWTNESEFDDVWPNQSNSACGNWQMDNAERNFFYTFPIDKGLKTWEDGARWYPYGHHNCHLVRQLITT